MNCVYDNSEESVKESTDVYEDVIRPSEIIRDAMNVPENSSLRKSKPSVDDLVNDVCMDNQEEKEYVDDEVCENNSFVTMDKTNIERSMQAECSTVSSNIKLLPSLSISTFHLFTDSSCENSKVNLEGIGHLSSNNIPSQAYSNSKIQNQSRVQKIVKFHRPFLRELNYRKLVKIVKSLSELKEV